MKEKSNPWATTAWNDFNTRLQLITVTEYQNQYLQKDRRNCEIGEIGGEFQNLGGFFHKEEEEMVLIWLDVPENANEKWNNLSSYVWLQCFQFNFLALFSFFGQICDFWLGFHANVPIVFGFFWSKSINIIETSITWKNLKSFIFYYYFWSVNFVKLGEILCQVLLVWTKFSVEFCQSDGM